LAKYKSQLKKAERLLLDVQRICISVLTNVINAFMPLAKSVDVIDVFTLKRFVLYAKVFGNLILNVPVDDVNVNVTVVVAAHVA